MNNSKGDCPNIKDMINAWYSVVNVPITSNLNKFTQTQKENENKPPSKWSTVWLLNKIFKILGNFGTNISDEKKMKFFNFFNSIKVFYPVFFIIFTFLIITECKPIYQISESTIVENIPSTIIYVFLFLFVLVIGMIIYNFMKKISNYISILNNIKEKKFKSFYVIIILISLGMILLVNFIIPTIVSPIINSISSLTDDQKTTYTRVIVFIIFIILAILLLLIFSKMYKNKRLNSGSQVSKNDACYFSLLSGISPCIYLIFSLLLITGVVTYLFNGMGSFILTMLLGFIFFFYIIAIYVMIYTIFEGPNYKKILVFTVLLLIIVSLAGIYLLNEVVSSIDSLCETSSDSSSIDVGTILSNVFLPIILFMLSIYLYGMIYNDKIWPQNKKKFYTFYSIYTIIIIVSWFSSNISVGGVFTLLWIIITILQRKWVGKLVTTIKDDTKNITLTIKRNTKKIHNKL